MIFNSLDFLIFLTFVFFLYWFAFKNNLKFQNILLLISSYFFYSCWDWRFVFLLLFSTLLDYFSGIMINNTENIKFKKIWFWISISVNLGLLCILKYYNFFVESFAIILDNIGLKTNPTILQIILPVGISFYTFHGLSYVIDIYKNKIKAEKNFIDYAVFVSFFPLLVAGPIERATHLLPQIQKKRNFEYKKAVDGLKQILWGVLKKIVIADHCAEYANQIFNNSNDYSGSTLALGAIFFSFQIYCDFSAYSDIALGTARLFGIELLKNFSYPYFSRDIAEFWRRWHISLSSWFRDYLYIPLGGSKGGIWKKIINTLIIFIVSGFWHGANWTFIIWGLLNALYIMPSIIMNKNRNNIEIVAKGKLLPSFKDLANIGITFILTAFAWIFFRSENLKQAFNYIMKMFSKNLFSIPDVMPMYLLFIITIFIVIEWIGRESHYPIANLFKNWNRIYRWSFYVLICFIIFLFQGKEQQFIYFQF